MLPQLLTGAVEAAGEAPAIVFEGREVSYRELDAASSRLARVLIARGVGPGSVVALGMSRSVESVLSVWAVAKTGAAFAPVDPAMPIDRLRIILADSGASLGLTVREHLGVWPAGVLPWLTLDDPMVLADQERQPSHPISYADRIGPLSEADAAYVIFTSGSTGRPKGVVVPHSGLGSLVAAERERMAVTAQSRVLHVCSPNFDVSVLELLLAFTSGAALVVAPPTVFGGAELADLLAAQRVSHVLITPAALESVPADAAPATLRSIMVAGDKFGPELVARWARDGRRFFNGYGPTEATILATSVELFADDRVWLGPAIAGVGATVLDARLRPVPVDVVGELYLSGPGVARGYLGRPGLTAERFVATGEGARMYRTGDLVRRTEAGLEYVGRSDFQVKVRGFRIELGEIDAALRAHPEVSFAVTIGRELASGATSLVSYVTGAAEPEEVRRFVAQALPAYMVPAAVVVLDELPLNAVGKLDRAALPDPVFAAGEFREPASPTETAVAQVYADVLGVDRVGGDDDFFGLGGNSLLAAQAAARIGSALGVRVPIQMLFEAPSVADLAVRIETDATAAGRVPLTKRERPQRVPLSFAQQRYWFLNQFDPESAVDNIPLALRLTGVLDVAALQAAVADVVGRHETLHAIYPADDDGPYQVLVPAAAAVPRLEPETITEDRLQRSVLELALRGFDVSVEVPLHAKLFRLGPDDHVLAFVVHHIAADGFSMQPFATDLVTAYTARLAGTAPEWDPLEVQFGDYAVWQREVLGDEADPESLASKQIAYWLRELSGLPDQLELPADRPRPPVQSFRGSAVHYLLDADIHAALLDYARAQGVTLFMVTHAALAVLLARIAAVTDVAVGTPIAGRGEAALDDLIGMFVNTLVLRTRVDSGASFQEVLAQVREHDLGAFNHADVPFERLVDVLNPARSASRNPVFQVGFSFQNLAHGAIELPGLRVSGVSFDTQLAKTDLHVTLVDRYTEDGSPDELSVEFAYATDLFDEPTIQSFAARYQRLLAAVLADPDRPVGDIDLLDDAERARLAAAAPSAKHPVPAGTLVDLLEAQAAARPNARAAVAPEEGRTLTFAELHEQSNRLARYLIEQGAGPDVRIGLAIERSVAQLIAMYAIVKAGAAYVPIDPDHPAERIARIVGTAAPLLILTKGHNGFRLPDGVRAVDVHELDLDGYAGTAVGAVGLAPQHTAYVIFTSGSTGEPKGVAVPHAAVVNQLLWKQAHFGLSPADVVLLKTPATFDLSVWEYWSAPTCGATLVVSSATGHRDPDYLRTLLAEHAVTTVHLVPSLLQALTGTEARLPAAVRRVLAIGEALPAALARKFVAANHAELHNLYGPTEAAVSVTAHRVQSVGESVPIGEPCWNTAVYVLDARLHPVPDGVAGELYLAGAQLARGYHEQRGRTAERFVANPFGAPGQRLYRTGDLVRRRVTPGSAPELDFLGRTDDQVKIRGFRIELGDIESALRARDDIASAVVLARTDERRGTGLVAYVVGAAAAPDPDAIRAGLAKRLPSYMIPHAIVVLDALPLGRTGKVDRAALPEPAFEAKVFRAPVTPIEEIVADVFVELLGVPRVGLDDDFFALGGNSLLATRVAARLGAALHTHVPVRAVFEAPTVADLAVRVEDHVGSGARARLVARAQRPERIPLSLAQRRMWFLNRFEIGANANGDAADRSRAAVNNIPVAIRLDGALDVPALQAAVRDLVERHESLRTVYPELDGVGYQVVLPVPDVPSQLRPMDITVDELQHWVSELVLAPFDVTQLAPIRMALLRLSDAEHVLVWVAHHIAADGWSLGPLTRDLMIAYAARAAGDAPGWEPLEVQYADYTLWQRDTLGSEDDPKSLVAQQETYWRQALAGMPELLELPTDRPRPPIASHRGADHAFDIDADVHAALDTLAQQQNTTLFMVVHAALAVLLSRLSGSADIAIGTPIAGRGDRLLDNQIGMFVNTLVLRTQVRAGEPFDAVLARARETDLGAFSHADLPFERLVEVLNPPRAQSHHPLFQVALAFHNLETRELELPGLHVTSLATDIHAAKFDLQLSLAERISETGAPQGLSAVVNYATELWDEPWIGEFADRFVALLRAVAAAPTVVVGDIDLLGASGRQRAVQRSVGTAAPAGPDRTLVQLFAEQAARHPEAVAVRSGAAALTYRELDRRANALAHELVRAGAGPEDKVAIGAERGPELVIAMLAVGKAGAAYVPLDLTHPTARLTYVLEDAAPRCVLTTGADQPRLPVTPATVLHIEAAGESEVPPQVSATVDNLAYVIYTSGSTGAPKGVAITGRSAVALLRTADRHFGFGPHDVLSMFHSFAFDYSVWETWGALAFGGCIEVVDYETSRSPERFVELVAARGVTILSQTPSAFYQFADAERARSRPLGTALRFVVLSGEALDPRRLAGWFERHGKASPQLVNMYGITETTVVSSFRALSEPDVAAASVIGHPLAGVHIYVLDNRLHPVPDGVAGEIYVGGPQLARGYNERPDLTAARFVANPFVSGQRLYRSGDLARWTAAGELEYLGRADMQVQLRGFRIELGEIEAALLRCQGIADAAATVSEDRLIGYVVTDEPLSAAQVLRTVGEWLPSYMVPAALVELAAIPLTANGKVDRRALPAPTFADDRYRPPATPTEEIVAGVFADVLGLDHVGADGDFFALGGNSLLAAQVAARIGAALGTRVGVRELFDASGVAELAAALDGETANVLRQPLVAVDRPARLALAPAQERMYHAREATSNGDWNMVRAFRIRGADPEHLQQAVRDVALRHEPLRTRYPDGLQVLSTVVPDVEIVAATAAQARAEVAGFAAAGFDLRVDLPMRARIWQLDDGDVIVAIVIHHVSADGASIAPLLRDVVTAYAARAAATAPEWAPLPVTYADYTQWKHAELGDPADPGSPLARQLRFWVAELAGRAPWLEFPLDRPRPQRHVADGDTVPVEFGPHAHAALLARARAERVSLFMLLQAMFAATVAEFADTSDVTVATSIAGRGNELLDDLVGNFSDDILMRVPVDRNAAVTDLLAAVRRKTLDGFANPDVSNPRLKDALGLGTAPLFQATLIMQRARVESEAAGDVLSEFPTGVVRAKHDLEFSLVDSYTADEQPAGIAGVLTYPIAIFDRGTVEAFVGRFSAAVDALAGGYAGPVGGLLPVRSNGLVLG